MSPQAELGSQLWLCAKYRAEHSDMLKAPRKQNAFDSGPHHHAIPRKESHTAEGKLEEEDAEGMALSWLTAAECSNFGV